MLAVEVFLDSDLLSIKNQRLLFVHQEVIGDGKNPDISISQVWIKLGTCITILGFF